MLVDGEVLIIRSSQTIWWSMKSGTLSTANAVLGKAFIRVGEGLGLDDTEL